MRLRATGWWELGEVGLSELRTSSSDRCTTRGVDQRAHHARGSIIAAHRAAFDSLLRRCLRSLIHRSALIDCDGNSAATRILLPFPLLRPCLAACLSMHPSTSSPSSLFLFFRFAVAVLVQRRPIESNRSDRSGQSDFEWRKGKTNADERRETDLANAIRKGPTALIERCCPSTLKLLIHPPAVARAHLHRRQTAAATFV